MTDHAPGATEHRVLFVCMGNICRSPTAEGIFRALLEEAGLATRVEVDSAGTGGWHVGRPPDERARDAALRRGIDISGLRGRQVCLADFEYYDDIIAMDHANVTALRDLAHASDHHRIRLLMSCDSHFEDDEVPDPYYGGANGFERVLDMIESACAGLLDEVRRKLAR